eukprot:CAMPEP_0172695096 /NCGR_PEP_ID=MMETSP1074-20121228/27127_1 /TAXON_ID=2916 /ORGANISM="Ceratium fusus, Strain PA161109" /LENGTH=63 /DNA_ID=CAMNT_0013515677 /DNA_START=48 /DNA_END=237 /DNA_ORIENTATION=-
MRRRENAYGYSAMMLMVSKRLASDMCDAIRGRWLPFYRHSSAVFRSRDDMPLRLCSALQVWTW